MTGEKLPPAPAPEELARLAGLFTPRGQVTEVRGLGAGNVNDTYLVSLKGGETAHFILQRLNTRVFPQPQLLLANLRVLTAHLAPRLAGPQDRRFEVPRLLGTQDGRDGVIAPDGSFWRALSFIDRARSPQVVENLEHARQVGWALGRFHAWVSDLPPRCLADTLPGFHHTPLYLRRYDAVRRQSPPRSSPEERFARRFIERRRGLAGVLEEAKSRGELKERVMHGDPKVDNILLEAATGRAVGLVDLDTVKPGLVQYDLGDCLRSGANPLGEETLLWEQVRFEPELAAALLAGYLEEARGFLTDAEGRYLLPAARLIAFELGLRFFTDYLAGNIYFKASHPEHNLLRALVQFKLTQSIEAQTRELDLLLRDLL